MGKEKPLLMLVNPAAGRSTSHAALGSAVGTFCDAGYAPTVYFTTAPGAAVEMTERLAPGYERMVCLGGDGTLSDTIAGLMRLPAERRPHLGYIPMGTANDVASTLGLPMRQPGRAVEKILEGDGMPYDVGEMAGVGYFTYIAAFGAFTEVSYKTDQELKRPWAIWPTSSRASTPWAASRAITPGWSTTTAFSRGISSTAPCPTP